MAWNMLLPLLSVALLQLALCDDVTVTTSKGQIVGKTVPANTATTNVAYDAFLGIPYGNKPDRFQLPKARTAWTTAITTQTDGPLCPQPNAAFSEDCLHLNVYTPSGASASGSTTKYPVMAFVPDGNFIYCSASSKIYGPDFLIPSGVILVTINYRCGALGWLSLGSKVAPGNMGLFDVALALQWIQTEISVFGGDVNKVTLFGSGAGSAITQFLYLSASTSGLFHRAITQSGSALASWAAVSPSEARRRAIKLAQNLKCDTSQNDNTILSCLQKAEIKDILANQSLTLSDFDTISGRSVPFVAVLDTSVTAETPFFSDSLETLMKSALTRKKPLLSGFSSDEGVVMFDTDSYKKVENNLGAFLTESWNNDKIYKIKKQYFNDSSPTLNKVQGLVSIYTDYLFGNPAVQLSRTFADFTYGYEFAFYGNWKSQSLGSFNKFAQFNMKAAPHGVDVSYIFYSSVDGVQSLDTCTANAADINIKNNMVKWWTNFAKNGVPDDAWPTVAKQGYYVIDSQPSFKSVAVFENQYYNFWEAMQVKSSSSFNSATVTVLSFFFTLSAVVNYFYS